jgi:Ser-tRNA(Ala) deacylase AlaX
MKTKTHLVAGVFAALLSSAAFAFHCPEEMKKIDAALAMKPALSAEQMAQVKQLRSEGEALHKAGKHQEALDTLEKAKKMLGV